MKKELFGENTYELNVFLYLDKTMRGNGVYETEYYKVHVYMLSSFYVKLQVIITIIMECVFNIWARGTKHSIEIIDAFNTRMYKLKSNFKNNTDTGR